MSDPKRTPLEYQPQPDRERPPRFAPTWLVVYLSLGIGVVLADMTCVQLSNRRRRIKPVPTPTVPVQTVPSTAKAARQSWRDPVGVLKKQVRRHLEPLCEFAEVCFAQLALLVQNLGPQ